MMGNETLVEINKPALFRMLGYTPHAGQIPIHQSRAKRRVVACGVRFGKSRCAAMEALAAALVPRKSTIGWVCAPTYDLAQKVFREIVAIAAERLRDRLLSVKESEYRIVLQNLGGGVSEIKCKSADNPTSLLGEGLHFLIVDEAAQMNPKIWQSYLSQRLIDKEGWALLISTPKGKGWFYDIFRRGQGGMDPDYESWNMPSWTNPHLNRELIDAERERVPERVFKQLYGGEFMEGTGQVFRNIRECATGELQRADWWQRQPYFAGLDIGRTEDFTVFTILDGGRNVVYFDRFNNVPWHLALERVCRALREYKNATVLVDTTGKGEPVYEMLRDKTEAYVKPYLFTNRSKAALIDSLAILFDEKKIVIPKPEIWPEAVDELEGFQYEVTDAGNTRTGAPSGMHDDCVIALALAAYELRTSRQPFDPQWEKIEELGL